MHWLMLKNVQKINKNEKKNKIYYYPRNTFYRNFTNSEEWRTAE